jgi:biofilm protein TabA
MMIVCDLEHAAEQIRITPALQKAIDFLRQARDQVTPDGRVEIDGTRVFALFQSYETMTTTMPKLEAHRKYIDVQYIAAGVEVIGWAPLETLMITDPYNDANDVLFGSMPLDEMASVRLCVGQLVVLYPADAHAPKLAAGAPSPVKKIVIKVAV